MNIATRQIATRQIATVDAARLIEAIRTTGLRFAAQVDGDQTTLIFTACESRAAADVIAAELSR
jgi:hypothetical protein